MVPTRSTAADDHGHAGTYATSGELGGTLAPTSAAGAPLTKKRGRVCLQFYSQRCLRRHQCGTTRRVTYPGSGRVPSFRPTAVVTQFTSWGDRIALTEEKVAINVESRDKQSGAVEHASKMVDEAKEFTGAISETVNSFSESIDLHGRVQRAPIAMVSAALGIGFLVGGGLFSPMTRRLLKTGLAAAILPFVKRQLSTMAGSPTPSTAVDDSSVRPRTPKRRRAAR